MAEAPAKPPRGPAQRGRGGRAGRGAGGLGGGREEGGAAQPAPRRRPLGPRRPRPQHESRVRHAPSPGEGWGRAGRRAGRDGVPGEEAPGATRDGAPGRVTAAGGRREGERGRAGGAGRGLSLGLAQETGRRAGPTGCQFGPLVYSWRGSFNPKGGRAGGKTWSRIRGPRSGSGAEAGRTEGLRKVPGPPRSWKGPAEAALENLFLGCFFFGVCVLNFLACSVFPLPACTLSGHIHTSW